MARLCVVSCGQRKIWSSEPGRGPTPAGEAYVSSFSRLCREYALRFFDKWVILSAKYGFLYPHDTIPDDYNVSFNRARPKPISIDDLRSQIASKGLAEIDTIVVLGGRRYAEVVVAAFGGDYSYELPLAGAAGIGVMMQRLRRALDDDREIRAEAGGMIMDLVHWLQGVEGHKFVPLFELDDNLAVKIKYVGSQNRPVLRRHPQMEQTIIDLVEKGLEDPDWEGLIYVMGWHDLPHFVPLFVGKTERRGIRRQVSENIRSIRTNTSAFARWGDNIDYHIGDLSHALFRFKAYREPRKSYERWAATLFEAPGSTHLVQPVFLYVAPWYTYSTGPSGSVCSVKQVTQELIDLASTQFAETLLNARRR